MNAYSSSLFHEVSLWCEALPCNCDLARLDVFVLPSKHGSANRGCVFALRHMSNFHSARRGLLPRLARLRPQLLLNKKSSRRPGSNPR